MLLGPAEIAVLLGVRRHWFRLINFHDPINLGTIDALDDPAGPSNLGVGKDSLRTQPEMHPPVAG